MSGQRLEDQPKTGGHLLKRCKHTVKSCNHLMSSCIDTRDWKVEIECSASADVEGDAQDSETARSSNRERTAGVLQLAFADESGSTNGAHCLAGLVATVPAMSHREIHLSGGQLMVWSGRGWSSPSC